MVQFPKEGLETFMDPIAGHLQGLFGRKNWHTLWQTYTLSKKWHSIVGRELAEQSKPAYITNDTLWVHVRNSALMQHMQIMKLQLIDSIKQVVPDLDINDIRWVMLPEAEKTKETVPEKKHKKSPDKTRAKVFEETSSIVENKECRKALCRLWRTFHENE